MMSDVDYNYHSLPRRIWLQTLTQLDKIRGKTHEVNIGVFQTGIKVEN